MDFIEKYCNGSGGDSNSNTNSNSNTYSSSTALTEEEIKQIKESCAIRKEDRNRNRVVKCGLPVKPSRFNTQTVKHQMTRRRRLAEFLRVKSR